VTIRPPGDRAAPLAPSALICLDLETQGRLLWRQTPPEKNMVFEGSPVSDGDRVFTVLRRNEIQTQIWVAAYEAATGRLLWKQLICIGEPLARLTIPEASHILLTLAEETLFVSTNLGAIAALDTQGRIRWVVTYPRERRVDLGDLAPHWFRHPNYAIFHRGTLYVAPADTAKILAIDAMSGQLLWYTGDETASASFLLGVHGDRLIAGGGRLLWIGTSGEDRGRLLACWPEGSETPGYGRGIIVGQTVLWPGRDRLFMFDAQTARPIKVIPLVPWEVEGGNLLVARGHLVIAGPQKLSVFRLQTASPQLSWPEVTGRLPNPLRFARHPAFPFVTVP
jgi:outer membrane protein assembly factor BamB